MSFSEEEVEEMIQKANSWLASKEGQEEIQKAIKETEERIRELREQRQVDYDQMNSPLVPPI